MFSSRFLIKPFGYRAKYQANGKLNTQFHSSSNLPNNSQKCFYFGGIEEFLTTYDPDKYTVCQSLWLDLIGLFILRGSHLGTQLNSHQCCARRKSERNRFLFGKLQWLSHFLIQSLVVVVVVECLTDCSFKRILFHECVDRDVDCDQYLEDIVQRGGKVTSDQYSMSRIVFEVDVNMNTRNYTFDQPIYIVPGSYVVMRQRYKYGAVSIDCSNTTGQNQRFRSNR